MHIDLLKAAIQAKHFCRARHLDSVPVTEQVDGQVVWNGTVEVFGLDGHEECHLCYAWMEKTSEIEQRFIIILQKGLIITPQNAVHGWLAFRPVTITPVVRESASVFAGKLSAPRLT